MLPSQISPWPSPYDDLAPRAQHWHARRFASWLLKAGAESRFSFVLSSGPEAKRRLAQVVEEQGIEIIRCSSTFERPLPLPLTLHQGDHFNRTLYLIEDLDLICRRTLDERKVFWTTLQGQRGRLKRNATWVSLVIEDPLTLEDLWTFAPLLAKEVDHR